MNYDAGSVTADAKADLLTIYADFSSRPAISIESILDATIVYPGAWTCTLYYTLGTVVTFDALGDSNAVFILINSGAVPCMRGYLREGT